MIRFCKMLYFFIQITLKFELRTLVYEKENESNIEKKSQSEKVMLKFSDSNICLTRFFYWEFSSTTL